MTKMNPMMFQRIQDEFPDARVGLVLGDEVAIVLVRGSMRTIFKPSAELLEREFDEELMAEVLEEVQRAHTQVDLFYTPKDYTADGTHRI